MIIEIKKKCQSPLVNRVKYLDKGTILNVDDENAKKLIADGYAKPIVKFKVTSEEIETRTI